MSEVRIALVDTLAVLAAEDLLDFEDLQATLLLVEEKFDGEFATEDLESAMVDFKIVTAIGELDPDDEAHFTGQGKPDANVLTDKLGFKVTAKERDFAFDIFKKLNPDFRKPPKPAKEEKDEPVNSGVVRGEDVLKTLRAKGYKI